MSIIVAGRFNTYSAAQAASAFLFKNGFLEQDVSLFFVGPRGRHDKTPIGGDHQYDQASKNAHKGAATGSVIGSMLGALIGILMLRFVRSQIVPLPIVIAGIGAWIGSLLGAMIRTRRNSIDGPCQESHHSGVIVAVHADEKNRIYAEQILSSAGAKDLERANGRWINGEWSDFDPVRPLCPIDV